MSLVLSKLENGIGTLTMNHDEHRNALSKALIGELMQACDALLRAKARVLVLRANPGAKVWSAGHDLHELREAGTDPLSYDDPLLILLRTIQGLSIPVVAMIDGGAWGGACDLAMKEEIRLLAAAHPLPPTVFERIQGLRQMVYESADYAEGLLAIKERRDPVFRGE